MICKACKSEIPNGAKICPHCRTKQNSGLSCSGMLSAFVCVIAGLFVLSIFNNDDEPETRPTTTTNPPVVTTAAIGETERQELISTLENIAKTTFGKDVEVFYLDGINIYSVRVWREDLAKFAIAEDGSEWEKSIEQAISVEKILNQTVKKIDSNSCSSLSFSTNENHEDSLLLISESVVQYNVKTAKASETASTEAENETTSENEEEIIWLNKELGFALLTEEVGETDGNFVTIVGITYNASNRDYSYVQISYALYDDYGNKVGEAFDNIAGLNSGEKWKFEATGYGNASKFIFESLEAW